MRTAKPSVKAPRPDPGIVRHRKPRDAGLLAFWLLFVTSPTLAWQCERAEVLHVHDGDTLTVRCGDAAPVKLRVAGIDAPELHQVRGPAARDALIEHVHGEPISVALLIDTSGSTMTTLENIKDAAEDFIELLGAGDKALVATFDEKVIVHNPLSSDRKTLKTAVRQIRTAEREGTVMMNAVAQITKDSLAGVDGRKLIVLLSDGAQTRGTLTPLQGAQLAHNAGIRVFTISLGTNHGTLNFRGGFFGGFGFGGGNSIAVRPDPATMAAIARATGGKSFRAKTAAKVDNVYKELGSVVTHRQVHREIGSWFAGAAALLLLGAIGASRATAGRLP